MLGQFEAVRPAGERQAYTRNVNVDLPDGVSGTSFSLVIYRFEHPRRCSTGQRGRRNSSKTSARRWRGWANTATRGNNITGANRLAIRWRPPHDLQVTSITIPQSVLVGQSFDVTYSVTTRALGPTPVKQKPVGHLFFLSRDQFPGSEADRFLGTGAAHDDVECGRPVHVHRELQRAARPEWRRIT